MLKKNPLVQSCAIVTAALCAIVGSSIAAIAFVLPPEEGAIQADASVEATPASVSASADLFDPAAIARGLEAFKKAGCRSCHGWAANGDREGPTPPGPSLRATQLTLEGIRLTAACGRPSTEMPYFWREAYRRGSTECYGATPDQLGDLLPPRGITLLNSEELDDLAIYIEGYVKGRGDITFQECEDFFGEGASNCSFYAE